MDTHLPTPGVSGSQAGGYVRSGVSTSGHWDQGLYARTDVYASGVGLVLRSRQFPTFALNSSKKFSTTPAAPYPFGRISSWNGE